MTTDSFTTVFGDVRGSNPSHESILEDWHKNVKAFSGDTRFMFDTRNAANQEEFALILKELLISRMDQGLPAISINDFTFVEGVCEEDNRELSIHVYFLGLPVGYAYTNLDRNRPRWVMHISTLINSESFPGETGLEKTSDAIYEQKRWLYAKSTTKTVFNQMVSQCGNNMSQLVDIPLLPFAK